MEYITIGYNIPKVYDILGTDIIIFRENILDLKARNKDIIITIDNCKISRNTVDPIEIRMDGSINKLSYAMSDLFNIYKIPDVVYPPKDVVDTILGISNNKTTKKAYQLYKNLEERIKSKMQ